MCLFVPYAEVVPGVRARAPEAPRRAGATQAVPVHAADRLCSDVGECLGAVYAGRRGGAVRGVVGVSRNRLTVRAAAGTL